MTEKLIQTDWEIEFMCPDCGGTHFWTEAEEVGHCKARGCGFHWLRVNDSLVFVEMSIRYGKDSLHNEVED